MRNSHFSLKQFGEALWLAPVYHSALLFNHGAHHDINLVERLEANIHGNLRLRYIQIRPAMQP